MLWTFLASFMNNSISKKNSGTLLLAFVLDGLHPVYWGLVPPWIGLVPERPADARSDGNLGNSEAGSKPWAISCVPQA